MGKTDNKQINKETLHAGCYFIEKVEPTRLLTKNVLESRGQRSRSCCRDGLGSGGILSTSLHSIIRHVAGGGQPRGLGLDGPCWADSAEKERAAHSSRAAVLSWE